MTIEQLVRISHHIAPSHQGEVLKSHLTTKCSVSNKCRTEYYLACSLFSNKNNPLFKKNNSFFSTAVELTFANFLARRVGLSHLEEILESQHFIHFT